VNVLITAVTSTSGLSGVQRHALNLAACLLDRKEVAGVHLAIAPWQQDLVRDYGLSGERLHLHVIEIARNLLSRNAWFYTGLPRLARQVHADVVHASYPIPVQRTAFAVPLVVTLHDLYPFDVPQNFGRLKASMHRAVVRQCLSSADAITCVSHATAKSVETFLSAEIRAKTSVVYNSVARATARPVALVPVADRGPFLLSIAQHRHNKNLPLLVRVFKRLLHTAEIPSSASLVIIGMPGPETRHIEQLIASLNLESRVLLIEGISEAELQWCYQHCEAMVVPSVTEGFCLPVVESLLAGCRLICSDIPVLREIAGDRCTFVPLNSESERNFAVAISSALRRPRPAPIEFPQFSTGTVGEQYVALYHALAANCPAVQDARVTTPITAPDSGLPHT
jgi:glycosyltransferase involved in cell wall biosynthesis